MNVAYLNRQIRHFLDLVSLISASPPSISNMARPLSNNLLFNLLKIFSSKAFRSEALEIRSSPSV